MILRDSFRAIGNVAPVRFAPGAIGNPAPLTVSPQHRMLVTGWRAELYCAQEEVLVAAKHLVNGDTITEEIGGMVDYIHLLFDTHQIIFGGGVPSESYFPGSADMPEDEETLAELQTLFPMLEDLALQNIALARPATKKFEAQLLQSA